MISTADSVTDNLSFKLEIWSLNQIIEYDKAPLKLAISSDSLLLY